MAVTSLTSDLEFTLAKRVRITNETPPLSLASLLPTGLRNDFWKFFVGAANVTYDVPVGGSGTAPDTRAMKLVNGVEAADYGPTDTTDTYHSLEIDGVLEPELDLFLHEVYRYLDHLYPDHPDYEILLTPIEINDALYAAAAIIGYSPDYNFLELWTSSFEGGLSLTKEALMWKIRDLRLAAFRRKLTGAYAGYKAIFSSMYRHGAVYATGMYLPKNTDNSLNTDSRNLFRLFRLIDYTGAGDAAYKANTKKITFTGLVDPGDLFHIYEVTPYSTTGDTSVLPEIPLGSVLHDEDGVAIPN